MKRVIFVNRYFFPDHSATSQMLTDLAFHLASRGWRVTVLTSRQRYDEPGADLPPHQTVEGVDIRRLWTTRFGRPNLFLRAFDYATFYLSAFFSLMHHADAGTIVVAMTDPPLLSVVAAWACRIERAMLVNWIQDLFPEVAERLGTLRPGLITDLMRRLRDHSLRQATLNVVIGRTMEAAVRELGAPARLRENWADGAAVVPTRRDQNRLRREWQLDSAFVVGYSGNLGRAHDFTTILEASELLRHDSVRFLIIGSGPRLQSVQQFVHQRDLRNVLFKPYQPREILSQSLTVADVHLISLDPAVEGLIVPSKFYGIAAAGRPAIYIGNPEGEIAAIVREHDCGVAVAPGDSAGLTETIRHLANDRSRVEEMGRNARALFESHYDSRLALADWERLLEQLDEERH